jgi:hypothetical protein
MKKQIFTLSLITIIIAIIFICGCGGDNTTVISPTPTPSGNNLTVSLLNLETGDYILSSNTHGFTENIATFRYNSDGSITTSNAGDLLVGNGSFQVTSQNSLIVGTDIYVRTKADNVYFLKGTVANNSQYTGATLDPGYTIIQGGTTKLSDATITGNYIISNTKIVFDSLNLPVLNTGWYYGAWILDNNNGKILIGTFTDPKNPPTGSTITTSGIKEIFITLEPSASPTQPFSSLKILTATDISDGTHSLSKTDTTKFPKGNVIVN